MKLVRFWKTKFESLDFIVDTVEQQNYGNQLVIQHRDAHQLAYSGRCPYGYSFSGEAQRKKRHFRSEGNRAYTVWCSGYEV